MHLVNVQHFYPSKLVLEFPAYPQNQINFLRAKQIQFDCHVAIDPYGYLLCKSIFPQINPYYYSLELYLSYDHTHLTYTPETRSAELKSIRSIKGLIIQSEERAELFKKDRLLAKTLPTFILPVILPGKSVKSKSDYLRDKYKINKAKKIALHLGGIADWYSCLEVVSVFSQLSDWVVFFQGYQEPIYTQKLKNHIVKNAINNVFITNEVFDDYKQTYPIIQSCHLGIAWYNDLGLNFRTTGPSSGKITAYLKFGLPVIANNYPSCQRVIADADAGICVSTIDKMNKAVKTIETDYTKYSQNARKQFDAIFSFENYKQGLSKFLELDK